MKLKGPAPSQKGFIVYNISFINVITVSFTIKPCFHIVVWRRQKSGDDSDKNREHKDKGVFLQERRGSGATTVWQNLIALSSDSETISQQWWQYDTINLVISSVIVHVVFVLSLLVKYFSCPYVQAFYHVYVPYKSSLLLLLLLLKRKCKIALSCCHMETHKAILHLLLFVTLQFGNTACDSTKGLT